MSNVVFNVLPGGTAADLNPDFNPDAEPPTSPYDLMTLAEAKTFLGITDSGRDAQIQMWLTMASMSVAEMAGRVFAKERGRETWFCMGSPSLYLTHLPVKAADIESVTEDGVPTASTDYIVEESVGHLYKTTGWTVPIEIVYTGGYLCPQEVPADMKYMAALLLQEQRSTAQQAAVAGIRQLRHKSSSVSYHDPNRYASRTGGATGGTAAQQAVRNMLTNYVRIWC
jgi:hypothetical protein